MAHTILKSEIVWDDCRCMDKIYYGPLKCPIHVELEKFLKIIDKSVEQGYLLQGGFTVLKLNQSFVGKPSVYPMVQFIQLAKSPI